MKLDDPLQNVDCNSAVPEVQVNLPAVNFR